MNLAHGIFALPAEALVDLQRQASALVAIGERNLTAYAPRADTRPSTQREPGGVAIVPLIGALLKRPDVIEQILGATSTAAIEAALAAAVLDPAVSAIILEIDSPGGEVSASQGLANAVREAAKAKDVVAWVNGSMCMSGALWVAAQASAIFASTTTASVGSIGVVARHVDFSGRNKALGIAVSDITAGKYKRVASPDAPLSDEGRQVLQAHVDALYGEFLADVASGRGVPVDTVAARWADGRRFTAREAAKLGLIDGVASLAEVLERRRRVASVARAAAQSATRALCEAAGEDCGSLPPLQLAAAARILADLGLDPHGPVPASRASALNRAVATFIKLRRHLGAGQ